MGKPEILIIEDETIIAMDLRKTLINLGYSVSGIISSGEEAITQVSKINPDLILMDIVLSGAINGIEAAKEIYAKYNIPIIYVTSHADSTTMEEANNSNHYGYLLKPIRGNDLNWTINSALKRHEFEKNI